jgi:agmatinase
MKTDSTFAGIPEKFSRKEQSKIVLIPVPFDGQKMTHEGPKAFLEAAENMELYDIETDTEVYKQGIYLADAIKENSSTEAVVEAVQQTVKKYINRNKFVTLFGGENIISMGTISAFNECFDNISVLHIDAQANVKKEVDGNKFHNQCALNKASQNANLVQVGIRSMSASEKNTVNFDKTFFAHEMAVNDYWMDEVVDQLLDDVLIVLDLDALDPSIFPSTKNPVSGGLFYFETLAFLKQVFESKNVVGFELTGLMPNELDKTSDALASKLYYKMLSYKFASDTNEVEKDEGFDGNNPFSKLSKFKDNEDEY